jgi:hypothetical protein
MPHSGQGQLKLVTLMFTMAWSPSFIAQSAEKPGRTSIEGQNGCMTVIPLRNHADPTPQLHQM